MFFLLSLKKLSFLVFAIPFKFCYFIIFKTVCKPCKLFSLVALEAICYCMAGAFSVTLELELTYKCLCWKTLQSRNGALRFECVPFKATDGTVYYAVQDGFNIQSDWIKSLRVTIRVKATEQYFPVVTFFILLNEVLTFESVDETCRCDKYKWKLLNSIFQ